MGRARILGKEKMSRIEELLTEYVDMEALESAIGF